MYHDSQFDVFYNALSVSGKNGSLAMRMKTKTLEGKVVAKTGGATGTSALSGYITTQSGKEYLFSVVINQSLKDNGSTKTFEDKLCQLISEEPWEHTSQISPL
jgi:D-alanyl-D-alanine carboxypeptidase/D-alanyl-D-alanine-endopeptidase (penicillin-binding protein 4)